MNGASGLADGEAVMEPERFGPGKHAGGFATVVIAQRQVDVRTSRVRLPAGELVEQQGGKERVRYERAAGRMPAVVPDHLLRVG